MPSVAIVPPDVRCLSVLLLIRLTTVWPARRWFDVKAYRTSCVSILERVHTHTQTVSARFSMPSAEADPKPQSSHNLPSAARAAQRERSSFLLCLCAAYEPNEVPVESPYLD
jgi:hypothetical protein